MRRVIMLILLIVHSSAMADEGPIINYRVRLDTIGGELETDRVSLVFRAFADSIGGRSLWTESHAALEVRNGETLVPLGSIQPMPSDVPTSNGFWLEIQAGRHTGGNRRFIRAVSWVAPDAAAIPGSAPQNPKDSRIPFLRLDFGPR